MPPKDNIPDAPVIRPILRDSNPVVDLTASSSSSGNLLLDTSGIKAQAPSLSKPTLMACPDLIPIPSDVDSPVPKMQECPSRSSSAVPGPSGCVILAPASDGDGNTSSASIYSRASSRQKKQTSFFGSPIRHSVNLIGSPSGHPQVSSPDVVFPDTRVRFAQASQAECFQVEPFRSSSSKDTTGFTRKFTRFPNSKPSSDNSMRKNENQNSVI